MRPEGGALRRSAGTTAVVTAVRALTPRMTRVRLGGPEIARLRAEPGQTVKLSVPDRATGTVVGRDYTVRAAEPAGLDVDLVLHGSGPAATWARQAAVGQELELLGPSGRFRPDPAADWHVFAGDETALPAILAYTAMLPADASAELFLEVADAAEEQLVPGPAAPRVRWLHRDGTAPGASPVLAEALAAWRPPPGAGRVWIAGHTARVREARTALLARGVDRRALYTRGFWS